MRALLLFLAPRTRREAQGLFNLCGFAFRRAAEAVEKADRS